MKPNIWILISVICVASLVLFGALRHLDLQESTKQRDLILQQCVVVCQENNMTINNAWTMTNPNDAYLPTRCLCDYDTLKSTYIKLQ